MRYYSKQTGCTYLLAIHGDAMPGDVIPISEDVYQAVIANPTPGKLRDHDADGQPILVDPPPASAAELAEMERLWRDAELAGITWLRERHRDQQEIGTATTLSAEQFAELLVYMQQLRDWPQSEAFPSTVQRPAAPPWVAEYSQ